MKDNGVVDQVVPAGKRRPRIVRQQGLVGLLEAAYSQAYRLVLLVVPLR